MVVKAPALRGKALRISITMEENLLARIDAEAGKGKRSAFIENACRAALERRDAVAHGAIEDPKVGILGAYNSRRRTRMSHAV